MYRRKFAGSNTLILPVNKFEVGVRFVAFHRVHIVGRIGYRIVRRGVCLGLELTLRLRIAHVIEYHTENHKGG